jgi:nitrate reductase assembly molybdenum cofactor insertion protein NarJ
MIDIEEARRYLETGGLMEVTTLLSIALEANQSKVQLYSDLAMALCLLADEALKARRAH